LRKHQDILRQSGQLAVAVALCIAAMLAVYALAGYYTTQVLVGALIGFVLAMGNFLALSITVSNALDRAANGGSPQKAQLETFIGRLEPKFDYNNEGGAILLGVKKPVVKGHGAATDKTVYNTVKIAYGLAKNNLVEKISEEFEKK